MKQKLFLRNGGEYSQTIAQLRRSIERGRALDAGRSGKERGLPDRTVTVSLEPPDEAMAAKAKRPRLLVTIACKDVYLTNFKADNDKPTEFYFNDTTAGRTITDQRILGFSSSYTNLGKFESLAVGGSLNKGRISAAIRAVASWTRATQLSSVDGKGTQTDVVRHLLTLILMVSEGARFYSVEKKMAEILDGIPATAADLAAIDRRTRDWNKGDKDVAIPLYETWNSAKS